MRDISLFLSLSLSLSLSCHFHNNDNGDNDDDDVDYDYDDDDGKVDDDDKNDNDDNNSDYATRTIQRGRSTRKEQLQGRYIYDRLLNASERQPAQPAMAAAALLWRALTAGFFDNIDRDAIYERWKSREKDCIVT